MGSAVSGRKSPDRTAPAECRRRHQRRPGLIAGPGPDRAWPRPAYFTSIELTSMSIFVMPSAATSPAVRCRFATIVDSG